MIRFIVAIDVDRGLATDTGIPWNLPTDRTYYRAKIAHSPVLMGSGTYRELKRPMSDKPNYVATHQAMEVLPGFEITDDPAGLVRAFEGDMWVLGGAKLFMDLLPLADELYITQIMSDFHCTKFFPPFQTSFELVSQAEPQTENGVTFRFQVWHPRQHAVR